MSVRKMTIRALCGLLVVPVAIGGCEEASAPVAPVEDTAVAAEDTSGADALADVSAAPEADVAVEAPDAAPPAPPYPEGPYGVASLDTIANESFYDPAEGRVVRLSDFYLNPDVVGLVIVSSAGWCSACSYEAWDLVDVQERYRDDGLRVLYTLYEDAQGRPLGLSPDDADVTSREAAFVASYAEKLGSLVNLPPRVANFPVLIDAGHTLKPYFDDNATPMTVVVRTSDMRIEYRMVGYSPGTILAVVRGALF
jgi:hypothetical protein